MIKYQNYDYSVGLKQMNKLDRWYYLTQYATQLLVQTLVISRFD